MTESPGGTPVGTIGNIGEEGRRERRIVGLAGLTAGTALLIALDRTDAVRWWRLTGFPLWTLSAIGFLQAWASTCIVLARRGTCDAETNRVLTASEAQALAERGTIILRRAIVIGVVVTIATLGLP